VLKKQRNFENSSRNDGKPSDLGLPFAFFASDLPENTQKIHKLNAKYVILSRKMF
jgi:hypothetical protein